MKKVAELINVLSFGRHQQIDIILGELLKIDAWFQYGSFGGFKPYIPNWFYEGSLREVDFEKIKGYNIWLSFTCEEFQDEINVFYPSKSKQGQSIKVIFKGKLIKHKIDWIHGKKGLVNDIILPLLYLDRLPIYKENPLIELNLYLQKVLTLASKTC